MRLGVLGEGDAIQNRTFMKMEMKLKLPVMPADTDVTVTGGVGGQSMRVFFISGERLRGEQQADGGESAW